jgi:hypothetical protein
MNTNKKGFANIIWMIIVVAIVVVGGYFIFVKKSELVTQQPTLLPTTLQTSTQQQSPSASINETAIKFLSPADNEQIHMESGSYTIRWTTEGIQDKNKKVYLYVVRGVLDPAESSYFIDKIDFSAGSYKWILPKYNPSFANNFIKVDDSVKLAMAIYPSDRLPPHSQTKLSDLQTKPEIIYSGKIRFQSIVVPSAKFIFPRGGERFILGSQIVIKWELPTAIELSDINLQLVPIDATKPNGYINKEVYFSNRVCSYIWDSKFIYLPVGPDVGREEVKSGKYILRLGFRTPDGYYHQIDSEQFELN